MAGASFNKWIFTIILIVFSVGITQAQNDKEALRKKNEQLIKQIGELNKKLNANRSGSKKSILYIKNLEYKIDAQKQLVRNTNKENQLLKDEIYLTQLEINKLRRELSELKKEYKDVLVNAYKNKSLQNKMVFVLASKSITEAFRRVKYLEKYSDFQGEKAEEIEVKQKEIEKKLAQQEQAKKEKEQLLAKQTVLKEQLQSEKAEQQNILAEYRKNAGQIKNKIAAKERESRDLDRKIEAIIQEEIRIAREKKEKEETDAWVAAKKTDTKESYQSYVSNYPDSKYTSNARTALNKKIAEEKAKEVASSGADKPKATNPKPKPTKTYSSTAEAANLSASFTANKGKLPWPVTKGQVIGKFGSHPHPLLPNVTVNNSGVKIATSSGSNARAIFNGTVTQIIAVSGGNNAVMISHGSYFTVYNNLETVYVKKGDKIKTKQTLGKIYTDIDNNTVLDFQVWEGGSKQNPAYWVTGM